MRLTNEMAKKLKEEFPVFVKDKGLVYLDSSATSQMPESVIDFMAEHYRYGRANVGRGVYPKSLEVSEKYARARGAVAKFINADPSEIIFVRNATEGINLLSRVVGKFLGGTNIVLTEMEHHSNLLPWQKLAKRRGFELRFIKIKEDFTLDLEDAKKKIDSGTVLVGLNHVSNVFGTVNDLTEFIELAKDFGAVTVVDAAQSVGHVKVDVEEINCDFLVFSGHKIFGPTGIGVLYGVKDLLDEMPPFMEGGGMVSKATFLDAEWQYPPLKFEAGTPNIGGALGLQKAIEFVSRIDVMEIGKWNKELVGYLIRNLKEISGVKVYAADAIINSGVVSFTVEGMTSHDVARKLGEKGICVRSGCHCCSPLMQTLGIEGTVRVSFYPYNTFEDIDFLVLELRKIISP
ncbi:MAG: cysteine desulfurase [Nanoarchaeota archaeon]|nr:cysteine desulfurase [Nanoarchaeota archaeon]